MSAEHVAVVGAGIGGLSAALALAGNGCRVTVYESAAEPGGKMREFVVAGHRIDSGPTVFTMRWIFEALFRDAGLDLDDWLSLRQADLIARHAWTDGGRLDLYPDVERSVAAITALAGAREGRAYRKFAADSASIFDTLDASFMRAEKPTPVGLALSLGVCALPSLVATRPYLSLWRELGRRFRDPRLRQLFARYSTYCGSSPFSAPATLMLIAHAERAGVWYVDGGMQRLADTLKAAAESLGAGFRFETPVRELIERDGRVTGLVTAAGESVAADAVVFNGDVQALRSGLLGETLQSAPGPTGAERSLSALTLSLTAETDGFPLAHHTVFFGDDYPDEFAAIFERYDVTAVPTIYVCAPGRSAGGAVTGAEPLFFLMNAPPVAPIAPGRRSHTRGSGVPPRSGATTADAWEQRLIESLERHGLTLSAIEGRVRTTPADFGVRFPATDGALYGTATHGFNGSFARPGSRATLSGLYFAGGSVHPGPGVPMTAQSGRLAAASVCADLGL